MLTFSVPNYRLGVENSGWVLEVKQLEAGALGGYRCWRDLDPGHDVFALEEISPPPPLPAFPLGAFTLPHPQRI
jgi:hypothetical protein